MTEENAVERINSNKKEAYKTLESSIKKANALTKVSETLEMQKKLMGKGKKRKLIDQNNNVSYKWFLERKK
jgi:hypothetical protein